MKKPFYKQVWFWVVVVVLGGIIGLFTEDKTPEEPAIAEPQKEQAKPTEPEKKEEAKEPTEEEWQKSYREIALGEAQAYIELTVKGTITPENHESRTGVLLQYSEKITGEDKEDFKKLAEAVKSDNLAEAKRLYTTLGGEDFEELNKDPDVSADKTNAGNEVEETASDWKASLAEIIKEDSSPTEKADAVELLARDYNPGDEELKEFEKYIVKEFRTGKYLQDPENAEYMLSNLFKSVVVERSYDDSENEPIDKFAFDFYQNTKYVYRGADAPDSDDVKENEAQMNKALSDIK